MHECPESSEVWAGIARTWEATTSELLDTSSPILTVLGLRPRPGSAGGAERRGSQRHAGYGAERGEAGSWEAGPRSAAELKQAATLFDPGLRRCARTLSALPSGVANHALSEAAQTGVPR